HEFYAIALKVVGGGTVVAGHHTDFPEGSSVFFNSPFQILSWDIVPNWDGYYVMFSQEFIANCSFLQDILEHFPFLKIEKDMPFGVAPEDVAPILSIFQSIQTEYHGDHNDKFQLIETHILHLLNLIKRYVNQNLTSEAASEEIRKTDLKLLSRFQALIETSFYTDGPSERFSKVHSTSFYAEKLSIHPNHLNAVVKGITGQTAKQMIQNHILNLAKSRLIQTQESVKEIAYLLRFESPNHFSSFFKRMTSKSPVSFRKEAIL
ncbi:MAG: helix-turn-helix domain-containing protein, partial [Bacteroidota bacterium]